MRVRHSTRNLVDNICFFGILIVVPCALLLHHGVATIVDTPQFQAVVAAIHEHGAAAATNVAQGPVATPCADCARVAAVR